MLKLWREEFPPTPQPANPPGNHARQQQLAESFKKPDPAFYRTRILLISVLLESFLPVG
jgi:hypothetical protein